MPGPHQDTSRKGSGVARSVSHGGAGSPVRRLGGVTPAPLLCIKRESHTKRGKARSAAGREEGYAPVLTRGTRTLRVAERMRRQHARRAASELHPSGALKEALCRGTRVEVEGTKSRAQRTAQAPHAQRLPLFSPASGQEREDAGAAVATWSSVAGAQEGGARHQSAR